MTVAVVFLLLAVVVSLLIKSASWERSRDWPFEACKPLSNSEQVLYFRLVSALPDYVVLSQVQLSRMMLVKRVPKRQSWRNRIDRKSADFVLCRRDFSVAAVVELDDASHARVDRVKADLDKDEALKSAGIPCIRWHVKAMPDVDAIRQAVLAVNG